MTRFDALLARYRANLEEQDRQVAALVASAAAHEGNVPNNHWQGRFRAEARLRAALAVCEAIEEGA